MGIGGKKVLVCSCEATMPLDGNALAKACDVKGTVAVHHHLCRTELDRFHDAAAGDTSLLIACTQEQPLFAELLATNGNASAASFANIRERALWSEEAADALPKVAALLTEAALDIPAAPSLTLRSSGLCIVYGRDEVALEAAHQLNLRLDVTLLLSRPAEIIPPNVMDIPIFRGTVMSARGHLGAFELTVDDYARSAASSRHTLTFEAATGKVVRQCDLILDLSGDAALFPSADRRDGYFRPDPKNPAAVQRALFDLVDLVGEFEKPRYIAFDAALCAYSRSRKIGCTRCLDICPASAITPDGDHVAIDPYLCGGCGACHSVCPTGAATYAMPPHAVAARLRTLLLTYHAAGGTPPVLFIHDPREGEALIAAMARFGRGLPARVLPFALNEVTQIGFDTLALAFAYGAAQAVILASPKKRDELGALASQMNLATAMLEGLGFGTGRLHLLVEADPEAVETALYELPKPAPIPAAQFLAMGETRGLTRLALVHLGKVAPTPRETLPLPSGAPFGSVAIDVASCTLCLACVGACPTGALQDNPDRPQLRIQENACVQCGLCKATCPEKVITLEPRLNFIAAAASAILLKEEEPFNCINCGKPFGTKSSVDRILEQLAGKHSMFQGADRVRLIQMCQDCRVIVQMENVRHPFAGAPRPRPRTTDDDLRERDAAKREDDQV